MTTSELVASMIEALNETGIPFMIVGSLSSNLYGIPRSTKDADLVIQLDKKSLSEAATRLPKQMRLDPQIGFETVTGTTRHRIYIEDSDFMIELFELSEDPHEKLRFSRRRQSTYAGKPVSVPLAEDVVITKLRWSKDGKRTKDVDDVKNVLAVQKGKLDLEYVRKWCDQHGTRELFEQVLAEVE